MRLLEERERRKRRRAKEGDGEQSDYYPASQLPDQSIDTPEETAEMSHPEPFVLVTPRRTVQGFSSDDLLRSSPVAQSQIVRSTSSKLNYILSEVRRPP